MLNPLKMGSTMHNKSNEHESVKKFLESIKEGREFCPPHEKTDAILSTFFSELKEPYSWQKLADHRNETGDNIYHVIALSNQPRGYLLDLHDALPRELTDSLLTDINNDNESALHFACRDLNLIVFNHIAERISAEDFLDLAAIKSQDNGYNAFHLLCLAAYNDTVLSFVELIQDQRFATERSLQRDQVGPSPIPKVVYNLMARFAQVLGDNAEQLVRAVDWNGVDGLQLCAFTCDARLIHSCLQIIKNVDAIRASVTQSVYGVDITVLQLLCAFGPAEGMDALLKSLSSVSDLSASICLEQDALAWCYRTRVNAVDQSDFKKLLGVVADAYGNNLEAGIIERDGRPSILRQSLSTDGVIARKLLDKKPENPRHKPYFHKAYRILYELLLDMKVENQVTDKPPSPRFFSGLPIDKPLLQLDLHRQLLVMLFRMEWPEYILNPMATAVIEKMCGIKKQSKYIKRALLQLLIDNPSSSFSIPLALFCKISAPLGKLERQYIDVFQNDVKILDAVRIFYQHWQTSSENPAIARLFCERILDSRSILKEALLKKLSLSNYDNEINALKADVVGIKQLYLERLDDHLKPVQILAAVDSTIGGL